MAFTRAFQIDAFQDEAFQIIDRSSAVIEPGGRIVAGTFSRGQWHDLKSELDAKRALARKKREEAEAALEAERQRQIEVIAAEIAARREQEDAANLAALAQLRAGAPQPLISALQGIDLGAAQVAHGQKLAQLAKAKRDAEEEEEALALLMH